jgi:hypothetical protein
MINPKTSFRKPLNYQQHYILLVKTHGIWCIDSSSWDENEVIQVYRKEKRLNPMMKTKVVTSPSDDERVIRRIVAEMNRYAR